MLVDNISVLSPLRRETERGGAPLERAQSQHAVQAQRGHTGAPSVSGQRSLRNLRHASASSMLSTSLKVFSPLAGEG